jgi:signal peptidase
MENTSKKKKTWKIIANVVFWLVLVTIVIYSTVTLFSEKDNNMTSLLGISALTVQSDSMEPTFDEGDLIFVKTKFEIQDLVDRFENDDKVVITFRVVRTTEQGTIVYYNTHTVKNITEVGGLYWFYTQGDNAAADSSPVLGSEIIGVWTGRSWTGWGTFLDNTIDFLKSSTGFLLFIVLPCLAFLVYEIIRFTKIYSQYQLQKHQGDHLKLQEEAIAIARIQLEKEMAEKAKQEPKADDKKDKDKS